MTTQRRDGDADGGGEQCLTRSIFLQSLEELRPSAVAHGKKEKYKEDGFAFCGYTDIPLTFGYAFQ